MFAKLLYAVTKLLTFIFYRPTYGKSCLSSGFILSGRYISQNYLGAMAICRCYGAPDLFVTFTCNPKWGDVADVLRFNPGLIQNLKKIVSYLLSAL
jgi:hypothetical protein